MSTSLFKKCWRNRLWWAKPPLSPHKRSRPDSFSSVMSDNDLVSLKSGEINSISDTEHDSEKGGAVDLFADVFEEKESLTNSPLLLKRIGYRLVMNLQQCLSFWMLSFCTSSGSLGVILWWKLSDRSRLCLMPQCVDFNSNILVCNQKWPWSPCIPFWYLVLSDY